MKTISYRIKNKLSYNSSFFLFDKWLNAGPSITKVLGRHPKKLLVCILHGKCNQYRVGYLYNYYIGYKESTEFIFYSDYEDLQKHVVRVSQCTTYSSNELKHINVLNALKKSLMRQFSYILFVDDDTFVNLELFLHLIDTNYFSKTSVYGEVLKPDGVNGNRIFSKFPHLQYSSGGAGYLISYDLFSSKHSFKNFRTGYSDVSFGLNFNKEIFSNSDLFKSQQHSFYGIEEKRIKKYLTFHYVRTEEQFNKYVDAVKIKLSPVSSFNKLHEIS